MPLNETLDRHNREMDSIVEDFRRRLNGLVERAVARTTVVLADSVGQQSGRIISGIPTVRRVDRVFLDALQEAGYDDLLDSFTGQFPRAIPWFGEIIEEISANLAEPLPPVRFTGKDLDLFAQATTSAAEQMEAEVERVALTAKRQAIFSVAGMNRAELIVTMAEELGKSTDTVTALADTALPSFYRSVNNRGFQVIEEGVDAVARYRYYGPLDRINRPFCRREMERARAGERFTREEIDAKDNGTSLPVMTYCGGFRCRHQWILEGLR